MIPLPGVTRIGSPDGMNEIRIAGPVFGQHPNLNKRSR